jgi:hypothetical protein
MRKLILESFNGAQKQMGFKKSAIGKVVCSIKCPTQVIVTTFSFIIVL